MSVITHQDIVWHRIKDIIVTTGKISSVQLFTKAEQLKFMVNLILRSLTLGKDKRLTKDSANLSVTIFCETNKFVVTIRKQLIVSENTFEKGCQIVVRIPEIVQLIDIFTIK